MNSQPAEPGGEPLPSGAPPLPPLNGPEDRGPSEPTGASGAAASNNFFDWIRRQGITRGRERWVGGVASGTAERIGVDPIIIRGVIVVLTLFAGIGLFAYGVAWALLPEPDGRIHVEEVARGRWSAGMTGATILTMLGVSGSSRGVVGPGWGNGWSLWPLIWVAGVVGLVYWLANRNKPRRPGSVPGAGGSGTSNAGPGDGPSASTFASAGVPSAPASAAAHPAGYRAGSRAPYPGGASAGSGYAYQELPLPEPSPAHPRHRHPGAALVALSAGLALVAGGTVLTLDSAGIIDLGGHAASVAWAAAAIILGLGIVAAGILGRTSGVLGFFAVVAVLSAGFLGLASNPDNLSVGRSLSWNPGSISQLQDGYSMAAGTGEIDLRTVGESAPLPSDVVVPINAAASTVNIRIPANIPVKINTRLAFGTVHFNDGTDSGGAWNPDQRTYNSSAPGHPLILELQGAFSTINIIPSGSGSNP